MTNSPPPRKTDLIQETINDESGNLSRVARLLGVDYHALTTRYAPPVSTFFRPAIGPEPSDISTLGREGFQQFVVAVKRAGSGWPEKYKDAIADARRKFDAGTHEMFQTSDNGWVVQYLIPYLVPVERRRFFEDMVAF